MHKPVSPHVWGSIAMFVSGLCALLVAIFAEGAHTVGIFAALGLGYVGGSALARLRNWLGGVQSDE